MEQEAKDQTESLDLKLYQGMHLHGVPPKLINPQVTIQVQLFEYHLELSPLSALKTDSIKKLSYFTLKWGGFNTAQQSVMLNQL